MRAVRQKCVPARQIRADLLQRSAGTSADVVNGWTMPRVREFPLLARTVDIALMEKIAESLLEARLGRAADEGVKVGRAEIAVSSQKPEYLDITGREFQPLAGRHSSHS